MERFIKPQDTLHLREEQKRLLRYFYAPGCKRNNYEEKERKKIKHKPFMFSGEINILKADCIVQIQISTSFITFFFKTEKGKEKKRA